MARKYAAIMASMGMTIILIRCLRAGGGFESAILSAMFWTFVYGFVGYAIGSIARNTVDEVAQSAGTVGYELLCALARRVPVVEAG